MNGDIVSPVCRQCRISGKEKQSMKLFASYFMFAARIFTGLFFYAYFTKGHTRNRMAPVTA